ncbi:E3 ubiquitin-protein ligase RNF126-like [Nilaparvata lugens]|nr:E3 ubiquitin-protein ligase RNF126-like [Nilaparvata lugens]
MAEETNIENLLTREDRYYCHKCQSEVRNLLPGFQCPSCQYGFVELMEQPEANDESDSSFSDVDDFHPVEMLSSILSSELAGTGGGRRGARRNRDRLEPVENILQDLL